MSRRGTVRLHSDRDSRDRSPHSRTLARNARRYRACKRALKHAAVRDCGRRCVYCATVLSVEAATLDHVIPVARGGTNTLGNLVAACARCNRLKGDLLPCEFFARYPMAGVNFVQYARAVHRSLKRGARRVVSLVLAA